MQLTIIHAIYLSNAVVGFHKALCFDVLSAFQVWIQPPTVAYHNWISCMVGTGVKQVDMRHNMVTDEPSDSFPNQKAWYSSKAHCHTPDLNIQKYGITVKSVKSVKHVKHSKKKDAERSNTMHCTTNVFQVFHCLECDVTSIVLTGANPFYVLSGNVLHLVGLPSNSSSTLFWVTNRWHNIPFCQPLHLGITCWKSYKYLGKSQSIKLSLHFNKRYYHVLFKNKLISLVVLIQEAFLQHAWNALVVTSGMVVELQ